MYKRQGMYIERLFPAMGVRFIAINDGIDSGEAKSQSDEIIIPFKNLINDAYCRDISIKIRSHLEIKRKQGDVITAFVPYGYKKNDKDKHKLEIDVYAANVVKDIFRMKLHGKSQDAIACELNSSGILPPAEYKASTGSNYQTCFKTKEKSEWTSVMVRRILTNEVYIGNLVQGKQTTPNHKVKKTIIKEKCEWIRIETVSYTHLYGYGSDTTTFDGRSISWIHQEPFIISGTGADGFYYTYDCGPITQAGSYRFNTTFRSTNFPNTTRSFSTVFTFSAN